jgi:hypothetical protein
LDRDLLITQAADAALVFNRQLNILLDACDFYIQRYPVETKSHLFELKDLHVSVKELGSLPYSIATRLSAWKLGEQPTISAEGFETYILLEFELHINSLVSFLERKHIDTDPFDKSVFDAAMRVFKKNNHLLTNTLSTS